MINLDTIKDFFTSLSSVQILQCMGAYFFCFLLMIAFLLYRHETLMIGALQKAKQLNAARSSIQDILTEYNALKTNKADVDDKLIKDKNFYLVKFYQDTISAVGITGQVEPSLTTGQGPMGYTEESLQLIFAKITMQQLSKFLELLQSTPRVTIKNLEISKGNVDKKINVSMALATLKPIIDKTSSTK